MAEPKASANPVHTLEALTTYVTSLETGAAAQNAVSLGDLLGERVDRVRLWQGSNHHRTMVREVSLQREIGQFPKGGGKGALSKKKRPELARLMEQISNPEISVDLTLDMESGAVSLAVATEPALVGQDLTALTNNADPSSFPTFEDEPFGDEYWSAEEAAGYLGVAKSTITRKIKANELIGFKLFKNALYVPREQIDGKAMVEGVSDVLEMFSFNHHETWSFLSSSLFHGETDLRPIDKLRSAKSGLDREAVLAELRAATEGFDFGDHM